MKRILIVGVYHVCLVIVSLLVCVMFAWSLCHSWCVSCLLGHCVIAGVFHVCLVFLYPICLCMDLTQTFIFCFW